MEFSLRRYNQLDEAIPKKKKRVFGDPLNYFKAHFEKYKGMKRSELKKFDPSFYNALNRTNQLKDAIPHVDYSTRFKKKLTTQNLLI